MMSKSSPIITLTIKPTYHRLAEWAKCAAVTWASSRPSKNCTCLPVCHPLPIMPPPCLPTAQKSPPLRRSSRRGGSPRVAESGFQLFSRYVLAALYTAGPKISATFREPRTRVATADRGRHPCDPALPTNPVLPHGARRR